MDLVIFNLIRIKLSVEIVRRYETVFYEVGDIARKFPETRYYSTLKRAQVKARETALMWSRCFDEPYMFTTIDRFTGMVVDADDSYEEIQRRWVMSKKQTAVKHFD